MKKYVLSYKDFLNSQKLQEALTPEQDAIYSKIQVVKEVKTIHNKIFGDQERIYLPFDPSIFNINLDKSTLQEEIEEILTSNGYEIVSYTQNQCVKTGQKNITKIGKVLVSKNINRKDLADAYGQEVDKLKAVKDSSNLLVVFSRNYDDVASMSTKKAWNSCQNLSTDSGYSDYLREYVAKDLEQGSIIAYLIKSTDKEILDPEARILIKPFINNKNEKDIVLLPCTKTYHRGTNSNTPLAYPKFPEFVMSWVKQVQPNIIEGTYQMNDKVYQDGATELKIKKPLTKEEKERIENPKTYDDFMKLFDFYQVPIYQNQIKLLEDGLIEYKLDMKFDSNYRLNFDFNEDEYLEYNGILRRDEKYGDDIDYERIYGDISSKWTKYIKVIKGDLDLEEMLYDITFENLERVEGKLKFPDTIGYVPKLPKLKYIGKGLNYICNDMDEVYNFIENLEYNRDGSLDFSGLSFDNIDFLGNLKECYVLNFDACKNLRDITGLEKLKYVKDLNFTYCESLENLNGLESLEKVSSLNFTYCKNLESLDGLESLEEVSYLNFNACENLRDISALKNLKKVEAIYFDRCKNLESLDGLPKNLKVSSIIPKVFEDMYKEYIKK